MKTFRVLAAIAFVLVCNLSFGQTPNTTTHDFNTFEINNYIALQQQELSYKICKWISDRKIKEYVDYKLSKEFKPDSFGFVEVKSIQNPNNPGDIYDKIDTIIHHPANPYNGWFNFISNKVLCFTLTVNDSVFMDYSKIQPFLSDELRTFINFIKAKSNEIQYKGYRFSLSGEYKHIRSKIWDLAFSGKVKAYEEDTSKKFLSLNELKVHASL